MNNSEIKYLLKRYFDNTISVPELNLLEALIDNIEKKKLQEILTSIDIENNIPPFVAEGEINDRLAPVFDVLMAKISDEASVPRKLSFIYKHWLAVAASLLVISSVALYVNLFSDLNKKELIVEDIFPAKPFAEISLTNGDVIQIDSLSIGLIYRNDELSVYKTATGEIVYENKADAKDVLDYIMVSTPKGGFTKLKLSDGSVVALNADSKLRYPLHFNGKSREVEAEGEIYFEIAKDPNKPFVIHSEKQSIEVLGTKFNLQTGPDVAKTTLVEGSVKVIVANQEYFLQPGEQSIVSNGVKIKNIVVAQEIDWRQDHFVFDSSSFIEILKEIENWYNVQFIFITKDIKNVELSGKISRQVKLSELLKVLEINTKYKFEIQERRVLVK